MDLAGETAQLSSAQNIKDTVGFLSFNSMLEEGAVAVGVNDK